MKRKIFCVDFDGTCVFHEFPMMGTEVPYAVPVLKKLVEHGHKIILFTMRSDVEKPEGGEGIINKAGLYLTEAINWFKSKGIPLYGIQTNPTQKFWTHSPKAYGHHYIDDAALGCPLLTDSHENPYVDWIKIDRMLQKMGAYNTEQ